jgi:hypothetical protein
LRWFGQMMPVRDDLKQGHWNRVNQQMAHRPSPHHIGIVKDQVAPPVNLGRSNGNVGFRG